MLHLFSSNILLSRYLNGFHFDDLIRLFVCLMLLNAIFNNISWRSVLLVEETGGPGENHRPVASH